MALKEYPAQKHIRLKSTFQYRILVNDLGHWFQKMRDLLEAICSFTPHIQSALIESTFQFVGQFGWNPRTIKSCMYQRYFFKSNLVPDWQIWFGVLNWLNLLNRVPNSDQINEMIWIKARNWTESMFWIKLELQCIPLVIFFFLVCNWFTVQNYVDIPCLWPTGHH